MKWIIENWFKVFILIAIFLSIAIVRDYLVFLKYNARAECFAEMSKQHGTVQESFHNSCIDVSDRAFKSLF